jgi:NAD(P)-dependent dehydrogenase (short-subunit alcohol dehydrogenase family)
MTAAETSLVIGAGSSIATALIRQILQESDSRIIAVSRGEQPEALAQADNKLRWLQSDYSEASIAGLAEQVSQQAPQLHRVFICNGILHDGDYQPEKRLEDLQLDQMQEVMRVNALLPMLWLKALKPRLRRSPGCQVTVFSARVGSISDNGKGGWYAYRASKAALNMLLKNAAIEFNRLRHQLQFLVFHPGTTDTALSRPFQDAVPEDKLFSPDFVASRLLELLDKLPPEPAIQFLDWDGKTVPW